MDSRYIPEEHEAAIYAKWEAADAFNPDSKIYKKNRSNKPFCIIMPPPNANDPLHVGHAVGIAIEDTLTRFSRMKGMDTLLFPGTDHAGIETQFVFEKKLQKNKQSRFNFDRPTLYKMIWDYVQENSEMANSQTKVLGASADWSRFRFMLDDSVVKIAKETFRKMHEDKLIYRDIQLVNYCTKCGTSYSELEVVNKDQITKLYYVRYRKVANPDEFVIVATTRPEPIFADTHLAVHPDDPKNKALIGTEVLNPLTDQRMPIIADEFVDPEFGTGIVKLTPAHDRDDFAVATKHNLPIIEAINKSGKLTEAAGKYAGLSVVVAREQIAADLKEKGLIEKVDESYKNVIKTCYRCGRIIEPLPLTQFFMAVNKPGNSLTKKALEALDSGETVVYGAGREKILRHWLENLRDWNISRQIAWGIQIPVWYQIDGHETEITISFLDEKKEYKSGVLAELLKSHSLEEITAGLQELSANLPVPYSIGKKPADNNYKYLPETDTFDTWFSSGQWPISTLKSTEPTDFERFYPTTLMETGYDILPFWVMRMMLLGIYLTGKSPFKEVYLHGLIRDAQGRKMSKSKGNVVNPLDMVAKYGADAVRMALVIRSTAGQDKSVGEPDFKAMRNLTNKIWNATRFVLLQDGDEKAGSQDKEDTEKMKSIVTEITGNLDTRNIGLAADSLYNHFWHWYCDDCIEQVKSGQLSRKTAQEILETFLKLLHPFMPFVTEACWQNLKGNSDTLLIAETWPTA
ncbi:MAG: valine--tRNA ligase [Candidatus Pacebacteria bacterium CG10_big_fil_rev_8_21_14_0_10_42_12]|nr:valine--tRNA ligase [Candidatus Paceibacterota bacterium]PIR62772.1 MAG: valine--tRNA ligase [Candidatus Pacebacteria bacterium CG10_big_fil_rev_8_21_14_0_10_42_12]